MALLSFMCLTAIVFHLQFFEGYSRNFPLETCSTDSMDILFLYFSERIDTDPFNQVIQCASFVQQLKSFPSNQSNPRVKVAAVYDKFSAKHPDVDVSSWQFGPSLESSTYGLNHTEDTKMKYYSLEEIVKYKIEFVHRLFYEMGGARKKVTKVSVIFIDGVRLSFQETRSIPNVFAEQKTDVKFFCVVFVYVNVAQILMNDVIFIVPKHNRLYEYILTLAICNQCIHGWWSLEHNYGPDFLSCYKVVENRRDLTNELNNYCDKTHSSSLASIETNQELVFLKTKISSYFKQYESINKNLNNRSSYHLKVGLFRELFRIGRHFYWVSHFAYLLRPVVVNNWLSDELFPLTHRFFMYWLFVRNVNSCTVTSNCSNKNPYLDGWTHDTYETNETEFRLCEVVLPRKVEDTDILIISPATNKSFSQALTKGNFAIFQDNIVSITTHIASTDFLKHIKEVERFPLFDCGIDTVKSQYISYLFVCDGVNHCSNSRDEAWCSSDTSMSTVVRHECKGLTCCDGSCLPHQWVNDDNSCSVCHDFKQKKVNKQTETLDKFMKRNEACAFICNVDQCVHFSQLNDGHVDCTGKEGPLDETLGKLETVDTCSNSLGHRTWAPRCVLVRDMYGDIFGCNYLSHLINCEDFVCPEGYVKCPNSYCIPQHYVLERHLVFVKEADCPKGEDEQTDNIGPCVGNFACWDSKICLHPDLVCDGHADCPHGDDEVECGRSCPKGLRCVSGTVTVSDVNISIPNLLLDQTYLWTRYLDLSGVNLSNVTLPDIKNLVVILLSNCTLHDLNIFHNVSFRHLQTMDISNNLLKTLNSGGYAAIPGFQNTRHLNLSHNKGLAQLGYLRMGLLNTLDLSHTGVTYLDQTFSADFPNIKYLYLSFTPMESFTISHCLSKSILQTLDLRGFQLDQVSENFFNGLTISQHLYTDSFELCCPQIRGSNIPAHTCHAHDEAISSCFDLIGSVVQRILLWTVAVLALLGNSTVIFYRVFWDRSILRTGYGLFVINLAICDFIMGVYLFIIAGADYYYRDVYVLYDKIWKESILCKFAGLLTTLSSETSTFFVFLITLDRFLVIKFPFGQVKLSEFAKIIVLLLSWIIGFLLALAPIVFRFEIYSSNAMCLGLPLTTKRLIGWEFSFAVFVVLNCFLCVVLAFSQRAIFRAMSTNRITGATLSSSHRRVNDIIVAKQLSLVALSSFFCWSPIGFMGFLSLGGHEISNVVYSWTTVVVLPINSAANPLLYTIPVLIDKWEKRKHCC